MAMPRGYTPNYAAPRRTAPFGWSGPIVLLVGAALLAIGTLLILFAAISFVSGLVSAGLSDSPLSGIFGSIFGVLFVGAVGIVFTTAGGWLVRFWWIFLLVDIASGGASANTAAGRGANLTGMIQVRCRRCSGLNPDHATYCLSCGQPI